MTIGIMCGLLLAVVLPAQGGEVIRLESDTSAELGLTGTVNVELRKQSFLSTADIDGQKQMLSVTEPIIRETKNTFDIIIAGSREDLRRSGRFQRLIKDARSRDILQRGEKQTETGGPSSWIGRTLEFKWNEDAQSYDCVLIAEVAGDAPTKLKRVHPGIALSSLLPQGEVRVGQEWKLPNHILSSLVLPCGTIRPRLPHDHERGASSNKGATFLLPSAAVSLELSQFLDTFSGEISLTLSDILEAQERLALIRLKVRGNSLVNPTNDLINEVKSGIPESVPFDFTHSVECEIILEGVIRWNVSRKQIHDYAVSGTFTLEEAGKITASGQGKDGQTQHGTFESSMTWKGTVDVKMVAR
jgi:hypothetical protein